MMIEARGKSPAVRKAMQSKVRSNIALSFDISLFFFVAECVSRRN